MLSPFFKNSTKRCPCHGFWILLCHVTKCCACHAKRNSEAESAAPATQKQHADLDTPPKYCACHAKRENDLPLWQFEASKRAFRARLPRICTRLTLRIEHFMRLFLINLFSQSFKTVTFCEASATFQGSHQMLRLPQLLTLRHVCAALPLRFIKKAFWTRDKMLCLPHKCTTPYCQVLRLPRKSHTLRLTRLWSIAPATQNAKTTSHLVTLKRQNEHFVRDFLQISHVKGTLPKHLQKLSPTAAN